MILSGIFSLNLRQKVILGTTLFFATLATLGLISYRNLNIVERKLKVVEIAYDVQNAIMEVRRYEKNFLLYGEIEALAENQKHLDEALLMLQNLLPKVRDLEVVSKMETLRRELLSYKGLMDQIQSTTKNNLNPSEAIQEVLREKGRLLVEFSQDLVRFEREKIVSTIRKLYGQLLVAVGTFFAFCVCVASFVIRKIIIPLRLIEDATVQIARGDFTLLPVPNTKDETERVIKAFNSMVQELQMRQNQLIQAKKLSSIGTLTSGIAHELNNPLNNISTSCQIALEELDDIDKEFLRSILLNVEKEVTRAKNIVRGLLEFSRAQKFTIVPVSIRDIAVKASQLIASQIPKGIQVHIDVPKDLIIPVDPQRMQQVFLNLFINALQAISEPPGRIVVRARKETSGDQVIIEVEDTGEGIEEEYIDRIFDPFFTTKEVGAGTGLGLSIVHGIIQQHNGTISVESKKYRGTKFTIRLPLEQPTLQGGK